MTPLWRYVVETAVSLVLIVGLAFAILYAARKTGVGRPTGPLKLVGRLVLDSRRAVYLVRVGSTTYVVGASEAGLTKLGEHESDSLPEAVRAEASVPGRSFNEWLSRASASRKSDDRNEKGGGA